MDRQKLFDSFIEFMGRFVQLKAVAALRDGFIMTTPFTICGSVFLLLANLPVPGYGDRFAQKPVLKAPRQLRHRHGGIFLDHAARRKGLQRPDHSSRSFMDKIKLLEPLNITTERLDGAGILGCGIEQMTAEPRNV